MSDSWRLSLPCTRAEAEAIDAADDIAIDAVLMTTEEVEDESERWRLDAYLSLEPDDAAITAIRVLVPSAADHKPVIERIADADWVTMSQAGMAPIREGRFVVHGSTDQAEPPASGRAFTIDAGLAFGTGHHATTAGCLAMLDRMASEGKRFGNVIDIGTGTGLLAFAASWLWPQARVMATDIDPIAIDVTRANANANAVMLGSTGGEVMLLTADGARHPEIETRAPCDLIIANILAGPLIAMASELTAIAAPDATILLAGLLELQREAVTDAYTACGCLIEAVERRGDWSILELRASPVRRAVGISEEPTGRGGWALDI